jgi:FKBP-type peptidyl-prolyl cis-trans isomerase
LTLGIWACEEKDPTNETGFFYDKNDSDIQEYIVDNGLLNAQEANKGVFYALIEPKVGAQEVKDGDSVRVHYVARLLSGTIVDSTSESRNRPDSLLVNTNSILLGLEDAIRKLKEGERATVLIPSYRALGASGNSLIPPYSVLVYDLQLKEVKSELEQVQEYLTKNNLVPTITVNDSLYYIKTQDGEFGTRPINKEITIVNYTGKLLRGTRFDFKTDSTFFFNVGANGTIRSWERIIPLMNLGEKGILISFSKAAYGSRGSGSVIPPYAPLMFELERVKTERQRIIDYIEANVISDTVSTTSGLYTKQLLAGTGNNPGSKDSVTVEIIQAKTIQNTSFITPTPTTLKFRLDIVSNSPAINALNKGLQEALLKMKVNERKLIIMPSNLAFGNAGRGAVPGKTPIVYEIILKAIKKN